MVVLKKSLHKYDFAVPVVKYQGTEEAVLSCVALQGGEDKPGTKVRKRCFERRGCTQLQATGE